MRNELELGSSGHRISGNSSRYCRLRSTRPSTAPRGHGTGGQRADSHWPRDSAEGFFGLRRGWGDREKAKMGSVSVLVGRAAHPTRKQPCAAQRAPRPPTRPRTPRGRCAADRADLRHGPPDRGRPGDVVARRREASVAQAMHGGRCPLAAHPRVPPAAVGRAPHSRRRASHTGAFLARRHVWFVIACVATRGRARPPPAHPGRRRLRRACPLAARRPSPLCPPLCTPPPSVSSVTECASCPRDLCHLSRWHAWRVINIGIQMSK